MKRTLMRLLNPFMKWLLTSPLHVLVSKHYVVVGFTGRKSGKPYATPVEYAQRDNQLVFITGKSYAWWKNLQGGAPVTLRLRGQEVHGTAEVYPDPDAVASAIRTLYPRFAASTVESMRAKTVSVRVQLGA